MEGSFCELELAGSLLFLVSGGGPTADKPDITFAAPADPKLVSAELTFRVPDCQQAYDALAARGATFIHHHSLRTGAARSAASCATPTDTYSSSVSSSDGPITTRPREPRKSPTAWGGVDDETTRPCARTGGPERYRVPFCRPARSDYERGPHLFEDGTGIDAVGTAFVGRQTSLERSVSSPDSPRSAQQASELVAEILAFLDQHER